MLRKLFFNLAYLHHPVWDTGVSPQELLDFIDTHPAGRALDMGCGTGTNVVTLAKHGWKVTGVDFTPRAIRQAKQKARLSGVQVTLRRDDVTRLPGLSGEFDLILDMGCYHSLSEDSHRAYLDNIDRLLASDGTLLLYMFIKSLPAAPGPGVTEEGIEYIGQRLEIARRKDGTERGIRPSAWLTIHKRK
jgi:cyclopropane fatty-acyl-phospholipid synthase-like methyltransferase